MTLGMKSTARRGQNGSGADGWSALATLVRVRMLVALLALPIGVLLGPDLEGRSWWVLSAALIAVGVLSAGFWLAARRRVAYDAQLFTQLGCDLVLIGALAAYTGGQASQFVLFLALVIITGGVLGRLRGGVIAAAAACLVYVTLPWFAHVADTGSWDSDIVLRARVGMPVAFLGIVGVLSGVLGERVQRAHRALERTARELDRVRVDNDIILRHLTTGVMTVDSQGQVAYINPAAEHVLGIQGAAMTGRALDEALPERLAPLGEIVQQTLKAQAPRLRVELRLATPQGRELPVGASTNLLRHEGVCTGVVAVFQDLTEVREMERRARRNKTLAEVGALAAGIAHELRNGLNPISGSVEYLQRNLEPQGETAEVMELISRESSRLNRFVSDLLNYSKERDVALVPILIEEHLNEFCEVVRRDPRRPEGAQVVLKPGDPDVVLRMDPELMRQVWLNLATNAFQAMSERGELVIRWKKTGDARVLVEFVDDGSGIAAEHLPRIGQPFFTTKEGGTGLGLAIAQRIVERHGGVLTLHGAPGRGATACVALPCEAGTAALAA